MEVKMQHIYPDVYCVVIILNFGYVNSLSNDMTILDMNKEQMSCIDFDTLNQLKSLERINFENGNMSYFPDKDCNNPVHEEDPRPLDLPNLKYISLRKIRLLKAPSTSLMPKLENLVFAGNVIIEVQGTPFRNNVHMRLLFLNDNDLTSAPNITGACNNLDELIFSDNQITTIPENYFDGCNIKIVKIGPNKLTSFPKYSPLGKSVQKIELASNEISGIITNDMVKDLHNLTELAISNNQLQGFDASFCHGNQPTTIFIFQNTDLNIFENPYRFCIHLLDTFTTKAAIMLTSTNIPCDHHRCWMKKFDSKFRIFPFNCPDGRAWLPITESDVCGQG